MIRKDAGLYCGPRLRKGEVFAYVGLPQNLKDLNGRDVTKNVDLFPGQEYRGTSLIRNRLPLGPYTSVHKKNQRAPLGNSVFLASAGTFLGPENSPAPFPWGVSIVESDFLAVFRSARRVCADLKI